MTIPPIYAYPSSPDPDIAPCSPVRRLTSSRRRWFAARSVALSPACAAITLRRRARMRRASGSVTPLRSTSSRILALRSPQAYSVAPVYLPPCF